MRVVLRLTLAVALFSSLLVSASGAQQPGQTTPPAQPTFRVNVDLVSSDVIVRNGRGQFVADLTRDDFEVFEDGVRQDLASFVLIHGGRAFTSMTATAPAPKEEGIILPPPRPTNDAAGRVFAFIVDDLHLDFRETGRIRALFRKMAKQLVHEGDLFGVVSTGPSSITVNLTYDLNRLEEVTNKITGGGLRPSDIIEAGYGSQGPPEVRYRAHVGFSVAYDLMRNLRQVQNRRKAVVLISNGYDFDPFAGAARSPGGVVNPMANLPDAQPFGTDDRMRNGAQFAEAELSMELHELTREANRSNATIYAIDPRGLVAGQDLDEQVDVREWERHLQKTQNSLRVLAEQTGGIAVINTNDFDKALRRIDAETSDYYVVGYYSTNPDPLARRRIIDIKLKPARADKDDLEVQFRKEYTLRPMAPPAPR